MPQRPVVSSRPDPEPALTTSPAASSRGMLGLRCRFVATLTGLLGARQAEYRAGNNTKSMPSWPLYEDTTITPQNPILTLEAPKHEMWTPGTALPSPAGSMAEACRRQLGLSTKALSVCGWAVGFGV